MALRTIARFVVPILGARERYNRSRDLKSIHEAAKSLSSPVHLEYMRRATEPFTQLRPSTTSGASWISDFVSRRRNVSLCEMCRRKYDGWLSHRSWWKRNDYVPDWVNWLTDCDGCKEWKICNGFYPRERIEKVLHPRFWRYR